MKNNNYRTDFKEYDFNHHTGIYKYKLNQREMTKKGNMTLFLERDDGIKHKVMVYPDRDFLGMKEVAVGQILSVEFVMSRTGVVYAKSIVVME